MQHSQQNAIVQSLLWWRCNSKLQSYKPTDSISPSTCRLGPQLTHTFGWLRCVKTKKVEHANFKGNLKQYKLPPISLPFCLVLTVGPYWFYLCCFKEKNISCCRFLTGEVVQTTWSEIEKRKKKIYHSIRV